MAKKPEPPIDVTCPCCKAMLRIDAQLAVVLSHQVPPRAGPDVDLTDAARLLREQAERREDKFRQSWDAEKKKEDVLTRKFEEALKKAKTEPIEKPIRDFDID
jgi:hypothetical protein